MAMTTTTKHLEVTMKQSSIEYLIKAFQGAYGDKVINVISEQVEQAKAMHKAEVIDAWIAVDNELQRISAEQYYNETFGGNK